jgi:hypothetical protein
MTVRIALVQLGPLTVGRLALNDSGRMPQVYRPMHTLADRPDLCRKG